MGEKEGVQRESYVMKAWAKFVLHRKMSLRDLKAVISRAVIPCDPRIFPRLGSRPEIGSPITSDAEEEALAAKAEEEAARARAEEEAALARDKEENGERTLAENQESSEKFNGGS